MALVETVLELGQIARHMIGRDMTVGASQRGFDIAQRRIDPLESRILGGRASTASDGDTMATALTDHGSEAGQPIGVDICLRVELLFCKRFNLLVGESAQLVQSDILRPTFPVGLHRCNNGRLAVRTAPDLAWPLPADVGIVDLDSIAQRLPRFTLEHHLHYLLLEHPGGVVAHAKAAHQFHGRDSVLGLGEVIHAAKPHAQRQLGVIEDGAGGQRSLCMAIRTLVQRPSVQTVGLAAAARRTDKALGPAHGLQSGSALRFCTVLLLKRHLTQALLKLNLAARHVIYSSFATYWHIIQYKEADAHG